VTGLNMLDRENAVALAKFVVVGGINTAFAYLVYAAFVLAGAFPWLANLLALVLGILFSFMSLGKFVFGKTDIRSFIRFVASWVAVYVVQTCVIYLLMHLGLTAIVAGLVVLPVTAVISFLIQRFIVFR
jgi:putative flippase GtrA